MFDDYLCYHEQDVWQGTQLLAIDVAAATGLIRRVLIGDELTEKEKKALQRTLTDLASVVPIGFLMLLPVSFNITLFHWYYFPLVWFVYFILCMATKLHVQRKHYLCHVCLVT